jgi:hypothetical protein
MSEIQLSNFQSSRRHSLRGATTGRTLESGVGAPSTGHADAEAGVLSRLAGRWLLCASFQGSTGSARARGWESHVGDTGILRKSLPECKRVQNSATSKGPPKNTKTQIALALASGISTVAWCAPLRRESARLSGSTFSCVSGRLDTPSQSEGRQ